MYILSMKMCDMSHFDNHIVDIKIIVMRVLK